MSTFSAIGRAVRAASASMLSHAFGRKMWRVDSPPFLIEPLETRQMLSIAMGETAFHSTIVPAGVMIASPASLPPTRTPITPIPNIPSGLAAAGTSPAQITLNWNDVASETGYKVERSTDGTTGWTQIGLTAADFTAFADSQLIPATTYYYRIRAFNGSGNSGYSAVVSATTLAEVYVSDGPQLDVEATDINAVAGQEFSGQVATFTLLDATTAIANLSASIDWGDGNVSPGAITDMGGGSFQVTGSNTYDAPDVAPVLVQIRYATGDAAAGLSTATIVDGPPTVATAAVATASDDDTSVNLSVLGADAAGEGQLSYSWAVTSGDDSGKIIFDTNDDNDAKNTVAVLSAAGSYTFEATITNQDGITVTSDVSITIDQQLSDVSVTSPNKTVADEGTQLVSASALDQFGQPMVLQPSFTWNVVKGPGIVNQYGLYTAPTIAVGEVDIAASTGDFSGSTALSITSPLTFSATVASDNEIDLTIPPSPPDTNEELEELLPDSNNFKVIAIPTSLSGSPTVHPIYGLSPGNIYAFRLRTIVNTVASYSEIIHATTTGSPTSAPFYWSQNSTASLNLFVRSATTNELYLTVTASGILGGAGGDGSNAAAWIGSCVYVSGGHVGHPTAYIGAYINPSPGLQLIATVRFDQLILGEYYFHISSRSGGSGPILNPDTSIWGRGTLSITDGAPSSSPPPIPAIPQNLSATPFNDNSGLGVRLLWDNSADNEDGYRIERSADGGATFIEVGNVASDVTSYDDTTAKGGLNYKYRVYAFNAGGDSYLPSNWATVNLPGIPAALTATYQNNDQSVQLNWTDVPSSATNFEVQWSTDGTNFFTIDDDVTADAADGNYSYTDTTPAATKTNYYRIIADAPGVIPGGEDLTSDPSNVADATAVAPPIAVDDVEGAVNEEDTLAPYTTTIGKALTVSMADGVLANDYDPQGLTLLVASYTDPAHGTLSLDEAGGFTYEPQAGFSGTDTFTYVATNGSANSDPATVAITVACRPVLTTDDYYNVAAGGTLTIAAGAGSE